MRTKPTILFLAGALGVSAFVIGGEPRLATADPCGMVPPLYIPENQIAIERVGAQQTFVSHYRGVETMVLRPGFKGDIDEFGMLIPFPSPPALRKVDDDIFNQIAAAVEPPEVIAYVQNRRRKNKRADKAMPSASPAEDRDGESELQFNTVRVVNREAIGMYDVAVLEAGSSVALKRWMDDNGFRYPTGMDKVTQEYVDIGWFFVAIKTQVGDKGGVNPKPGQKSTNAKLPAGSSFTGAVQGMGFRFKTKDLVVPMRLSAFNAGKKRNIVYVLTDKPVSIDRIPSEYVVRQLSGRELYANMTEPLPLRVIGGTYKQLPDWQRQNLKTSREPTIFNGLAKELIASDMLAIKSERLANPIEEVEKELLAIGESLELRGKEIDQLHHAELASQRDKGEATALRTIRNLHLTVIDGEFSKDVIAEQNLSFARYSMPRDKNNKESYDAMRQGPAGQMQGTLYRASSDDLDVIFSPNADRAASLIEVDGRRGWLVGGGIGLGLFVVIGLLGAKRRFSSALVALVCGAGLLFASGTASADDGARAKIKKLEDGKEASAAVDSLTKMGEKAVDDLVDYVVDSQDIAARGWAIVALGRIKGEKAMAALTQLANSQREKSTLVKTWAAAALIRATKDTTELLALAPLANQMPALARPLGMRLIAALEKQKGDKVENMINIATQVPSLATALMPGILALPTKDLVNTMVTGSTNQTRQMAASYVATVAQTRDDIAKAVIAALKFKKDADAPVWGALALFIPAISYDAEDAKALTGTLLRWHLWADINGESQVQQQIHNNLNSIALAQAAGYTSPGWDNVSTVRWLSAWSNVVGMREIRAMLKQQGADKMRRYKSLN